MSRNNVASSHANHTHNHGGHAHKAEPTHAHDHGHGIPESKTRADELFALLATEESGSSNGVSDEVLHQIHGIVTTILVALVHSYHIMFLVIAVVVSQSYYHSWLINIYCQPKVRHITHTRIMFRSLHGSWFMVVPIVTPSGAMLLDMMNRMAQGQMNLAAVFEFGINLYIHHFQSWFINSFVITIE